jgi:hypothetical protein
MRKRTMRICVLMLLAAFTITFVACGGGGGGSSASVAASTPLSSSKAITAYSLGGVTATIDEAGRKITVVLPHETNLTGLVATFATTGASVKIGTTAQASGLTANDFTAPVSYTVTAEDNTAVIYTVTVPRANLPKTSQTVCYDATGSVIACTNSGQDGDLQKGVAWPSPRFSDNGDQTVTDNLTGLMWTKDGKSPGPAYCSGGVWQQWDQALSTYLSCINAIPYLGHNDWRLPNVNELESLVNAGQSNVATWLNTQGFSNAQGNNYWSSTSSSSDTSKAFSVDLSTGYIYANGKGVSAFIWLVRAGQNAAPANLPKTGQTVCYNASGTVISCINTGQDGELQNGVVWPSPRFSDNGNQTVTDNITGLIWTRDGNAPGPAGCSPSVTKNWAGALTYVSCLNTNNYLGHTDWRIPNKKELSSLYSYSHTETASWLNTQGFSNVQAHWYWSSTTLTSSTSVAWIVDMSNSFGVYYDNKTDTIYVWPVRAGH